MKSLSSVFVFIIAAAHARDKNADLNLILEGVHEIFGASVPGALTVYGENSFPICVGEDEGHYKAFIAGTRYSQGRIVSFGHTSFVTRSSNSTIGYDNVQLLINSFQWVGGAAPRKAGIRVYEEDSALVDEILSQIGVTPSILQSSQLTNLTYLREHDLIIICRLDVDISAASVINSFVEYGGGLIIGATPWSYTPPSGVPFRDSFWANVILRNTGALFIPRYVWPTLPNAYNASQTHLQDVHSGEVWEDIKFVLQNPNQDFSSNQFDQQFATLHDRLSYAPPDYDLISDISGEFSRLPTFIPTFENPVTDEKEKSFLLAYQYFTEIAIDFQMTSIEKHPSADFFPGRVSQFQSILPENLPITVEINSKLPKWAVSMTKQQLHTFRPTEKVFYHDKNGDRLSDVDEMVEIENKYTSWQSTGLYAPAGSLIGVQVVDSENSNIDSSKLRIQIGVHTDNIKRHNNWDRFHKIVYNTGFTENRAELASPFGGLIFIDVANVQNQVFNLSVTGAVRSPTYFHGKTKLPQWRNEIRNYPAPWGELVGENVILSVRKSHLEQLDNPEELVQLWDDILNAIADLAAIPRQRIRPERIVSDVQISAGWMHSGYPIMGFLSIEYLAVNINEIRYNSSELWGHFHELGHNHQKSDWTFEGTGEVTCNLFALYVMHTVCHRPTNATHPMLKETAISQSLTEFISGGNNFSHWKSTPWLALITYLQLQETFGWSAYKHVFANYHQLSSEERPKTEQEKIDFWMVMFSKEVEENLTPYFLSWGIPITTEAENDVSHLPETQLRIRRP